MLKEIFSLDTRVKPFLSLDLIKVAISQILLENLAQEAQMIARLLDENCFIDFSP